MSFPANFYLAALLSALVTTLAAVPLWRRWCVRSGLVDDPGHRKIHAEAVPLAGGLAVFTGMLLPVIAAALGLFATPGWLEGFLPSSDPAVPLMQHGFSRRSLELAAIFFGAAGMLAVGWWDDRHELNPRAKFIGQLLIAGMVAAAGVRVTLFVPSLLFSYAATMLWIVGVINAFNFMDNMNGLCAGLGAIAAGCFGLIAAHAGQYLVAMTAFLAVGALFGFLPYNFPRARAFLGDSGSHLVGFLLAVLAILPHFHTPEEPRAAAVLLPLLILAVPLADMAWVVMLRWRLHQPFYLGDNNHLSHRLVRRGLSRARAVLAIWLLAAAAGGTAVALALLG